MKKILIITPDIPYPPVYGGRIEYYYKILILKHMGFSIDLIFTYNNESDLHAGLPVLKEICDNCFYFPRKKTIAQAIHPTVPYYVCSNVPNQGEREELSQFIRNIQEDIYMLIIDQPHSYEIAKIVLSYSVKKPIIMYRMHNNEAQFFYNLYKHSRWTTPKKYIYLLDYLRMKSYENYILRHVDIITCISKNEVKLIEKLDLQAKACWLPAIYRPFEHHEINLSQEEEIVFSKLKLTFQGKKIILFTSSFGEGFNIQITHWFLNKVFPLILERCQDIIFLFGGFGADKYFSDIGIPNTYIFSNVPSIKPYLKVADINLILTDSEAGVKLKLIEALFYRKKVISTPEGVSGSGLEDIIPNSRKPEKLAELCVAALDGNLEYSTIWDEFSKIYDSSNLVKTMENILMDVR